MIGSDADHRRHLLALLRDRNHADNLSLGNWEVVVRMARESKLLGLLASRFRDDQALWARLPAQVRGHLQSAINLATHRAQMVRMELDAIGKALPVALDVVALKGSAYILQAIEFARGRLPNDVDLLVARHDLDEAEASLLAAGWESAVDNAYDQRYYREWSHELPPMRFPGHSLEVDLHHTISPVTSRIHPQESLLFSGLQKVRGSRFFVLHPKDQVIHAAIHLFQDSDLTGRFRDLVDIDGLLKHAIRSERDWIELIDRARAHGASEVLWYALHFARCWLGADVPEHLDLPAPPAWRVRMMDWVFSQVSLPRLPDSQPKLVDRLATSVGVVRYHWLRMPLGLLIKHSIHKAWHAATSLRIGNSLGATSK